MDLEPASGEFAIEKSSPYALAKLLRSSFQADHSEMWAILEGFSGVLANILPLHTEW
jgi:hypothetical protein